MLLWWKKKVDALPFPEGPYATGCVDIMNQCSENSLFVRLLYPTNIHPSDIKKYSNRWVPWLPDKKYTEAFARLLNLWLIVLRLAFWLFGKKTHIPSLWEESATTKKEKLPVVLFSHGYGATRFLCSTVCNELASHGYLVVSIEHKDLSASITYYYESETNRDEDKRTYLLHQPFAISKTGHYLLRNKQLKQRSQECCKVLNFLYEINNGSAVNVLKSNFDLNSLKGRIDFSNPIIMGHSFGGATAMYTLSKDHRFKLGIILDGWMFPLQKESLEISQPMLFINTHTFHIEANIKLMKTYTDYPRNRLFTIKQTTHESQTDTPLIYGYWLNIFMKKLCAEIALKIQNNLILKFLHDHANLKVEKQVENFLHLYDDILVKNFISFSKIPKKKFSMF